MAEDIPQYVKVKMLVTTRHRDYGKLTPKQVLEVTLDTADRWVRRRIAVPAGDHEPITPPPAPPEGTQPRLTLEQAQAMVAAERARHLGGVPRMRVQSQVLRDQAAAEAAGTPVINAPELETEDGEDEAPARRGPGRPRKETS